MKKCPFCAEQIQDDALFCQFCGKKLGNLSSHNLHLEKTIFKDNSILVSNRRIIIGSTTYSLPNITSVKTVKQALSWSPFYLSAFLGAVSACSLMMSFDSLFALIVSLGLLGGGLVLGFFLVHNTKPKYILKISSSSGESNALVSRNLKYVQSIAAAINNAMSEQG